VNPRSTGILFLIAVALGAFLWFFELGGEAERLEAEQADERLFPGLEASDVEWIALRAGDGQAARFERREAEWWMLEPVEFPAAAAVERMADALASMSREASFEDPQPAAEYGLDEAGAFVVRFGAAGESRALRLGRDTPVGSNRYARAGEAGPVYTVAAYRTTAFQGELDDWREAQILDFDAPAVRELEASWPGGRVVARREVAAADEAGEAATSAADESEDGFAAVGDVWRLERPLETRADGAALDGLLSTLSFLRAEGFLDAPGEAELSLLEPPEFALTLRFDGDAAERTLEISQPDGEQRRWVRVVGNPTLFGLSAERFDDFPREVVAYRDRSLAHFPVGEAAHLDLYFRGTSGDPVVVRARRDDAGWSSEPEAFAPGALSRLVSTLSRLEADGVLAESMGPAELEALGLAPPDTVISVFGAEPEAGEGEAPPAPSRLAEVHLGRVSPDGIAARAAGRDAVFQLPVELSEEIPVSLDAFRARFRAEPDPADAAEPPAEPGDPLTRPTPAEESP